MIRGAPNRATKISKDHNYCKQEQFIRHKDFSNKIPVIDTSLKRSWEAQIKEMCFLPNTCN